MKWDIGAPCKSCPYRKDVKLGFWDAQEFLTLLENDSKDDLTSPIYGCHGTVKHDEPTVCAGWLLDQKNRDPAVDNIQLRLALATNDTAFECFENVTCDVETYDSLEEMCKVNLKAIMEMAGNEEE